MHYGKKMRHGLRSGRHLEYANKAAHSHIINDEFVSKYLKRCRLPKKVSEVIIEPEDLECIENIDDNHIENVIVIDGSFTTVPVKEKFPSSEITFFQFGALRFNLSDLNDVSEQEFIGPEDIPKLKDEFRRLKMVIPTKNIILEDETSILNSVRKMIFEFFCSEFTFQFFNITEQERFIDVFKWLIYEEYNRPLA